MNVASPLRFASLQTRLLVAVGLTILLTLTLQIAISTPLYRSLVNQYYQQKVQRQAIVLASTLDWWFQISPNQEDRDWVREQLEGSAAMGYRLQSLQKQSTLRSVRPVWTSGDLPQSPIDQPSLLTVRNPDGPEQVTCVCHGLYVGTARADNYIVQVAIPLNSQDPFIAKFWLANAFPVITAFFMFISFGIWIYYNIGKPLRRLADYIHTGNSSASPYLDSPNELGVLSRALHANQILAEEIRCNELRFLAIASHELRTPLAALLTQLEHAKLVQSSYIPAEELGPLNQATSTVLRLRNLSENLLTLSNSLQIHNSIIIDLFSIAGRVVDEWMLFSIEKGIELEIIGETAHVYGNPIGIEQMITNLISNALKFSPNGHGKVCVVVRSTLEGGEVIVEDNGIGLPENWLELLQPLRRGEGIAALIPGSGLGLAVVEQVVRLHNGSIDGCSLPTGGSRITIQIPKGTS